MREFEDTGRSSLAVGCGGCVSVFVWREKLKKKRSIAQKQNTAAPASLFRGHT